RLLAERVCRLVLVDRAIPVARLEVKLALFEVRARLRSSVRVCRDLRGRESRAQEQDQERAESRGQFAPPNGSTGSPFLRPDPDVVGVAVGVVALARAGREVTLTSSTSVAVSSRRSISISRSVYPDFLSRNTPEPSTRSSSDFHGVRPTLVCDG